MKERLQGSTGKEGATMILVAVGRRQRGWSLFFSLSLLWLSSFSVVARGQGKSEWQGKGTQRSARAYIARTGRRTGESKETIKSGAFNAKTAETAMITFSFFSLTAHAHAPH
jgi:hypothetical protein